MRLGAGRARAEERVDPAVGVVLAARRGDRVSAGEPLAHVHARTAEAAAAAARGVADAYAIADAAPASAPLVRAVVGLREQR